MKTLLKDVLNIIKHVLRRQYHFDQKPLNNSIDDPLVELKLALIDLRAGDWAKVNFRVAPAYFSHPNENSAHDRLFN